MGSIADLVFVTERNVTGQEINLNMNHQVVVDGDLLKVMNWYDNDNEWGYASRMVREAVRLLEAGYVVEHAAG